MTERKTNNYSPAWCTRIADIDRDEWNALTGAECSPFMEWEWLKALEDSGSIAPKRGWVPCHLTVRKGGKLIAAAPLYVKSHSEGEFVFDYAWADVARRIGIRYYPKLIGMSPATPVASYRFLIDPAEPEEIVTGIMLREIDRFVDRNHLSGCSFNFAEERWQDRLASEGFTRWKHHGYLWENPGFTSFDDYLSVFNKNQRRNIRRERASMTDQGLVLRVLEGEEIPKSYFPLMYRYYENTNLQFGPWAAKYLNRRFFERLTDGFLHRLVFVAAWETDGTVLPGSSVQELSDHKPVALSFLVRKGERLYGRYWGCDRFRENLYFNVCYYSPIEWAVSRGIRIFDPGMGASLKVRRGFRSTFNFSLHRFTDPMLRRVMESYIDEINSLEQEQVDQLNEALPFKKDILRELGYGGKEPPGSPGTSPGA